MNSIAFMENYHIVHHMMMELEWQIGLFKA